MAKTRPDPKVMVKFWKKGYLCGLKDALKSMKVPAKEIKKILEGI